MFSSVSVILHICNITNKWLIRLILVKLRTTMRDKTELKIGFLAAPGLQWCIWISRASTLSVGRTTGWCDLHQLLMVKLCPNEFFVNRKFRQYWVPLTFRLHLKTAPIATYSTPFWRSWKGDQDRYRRSLSGGYCHP